MHGEITSVPLILGNQSPVGFIFTELASDPNSRLPESQETLDAITALGNAMAFDPSNEEGTIPAVYTYFGQFIDHDITKTNFDLALLGADGKTDPIQKKEIQPLSPADAIDKVSNGRTMKFDLDSMYGDGATDAINADGSMRLSELSGSKFGKIDTDDKFHDLPRRDMILDPKDESELEKDRQAIIGDPRNDENLIVAQMHVAFIRAHNKLISRGLSQSDAQTAMRRRYQWAVLHDFLPTITDPTVFNDVITNGPRFYQVTEEAELFMPLEYSAAAYRFGHSMVRGSYKHNSTFNPAGFEFFFTFTALSGDLSPTAGHNTDSKTLPDNWVIDWARFFASTAHPVSENPARKIDTHLTPELGKLRNFQGKEFDELMARLATRNLRRGYLLGLPTGQAIAAKLGVPALVSDEIIASVPSQFRAIITAAGLDKRTPLWFYILAEAGNPNGPNAPNGNHLGPVGSRIVAETIWNAINFSIDSVLKTAPSQEELATGEFTLRGIINLGLDKKFPSLFV
jgi:hypothetical protein